MKTYKNLEKLSNFNIFQIEYSEMKIIRFYIVCISQ